MDHFRVARVLHEEYVELEPVKPWDGAPQFDGRPEQGRRLETSV